MASTNPARGMRDFLPSDVRKREYVIGIIKEVYESYGFEPLENIEISFKKTLDADSKSVEANAILAVNETLKRLGIQNFAIYLSLHATQATLVAMSSTKLILAGLPDPPAKRGRKPTPKKYAGQVEKAVLVRKN